jgi:hypothetical protein
MILTYLFIGVVFTFLVDLLISFLTKINHPILLNGFLWNHSQRVWCVILWPLAVVWFIGGFIKSWFN